MPLIVYAILGAGTVLWCLPFLLAHRRGGSILQLDKRARWGVVLQCLGYSALWQGSFWLRSPSAWQVAAAIAFFALACLLSWSGARALGKQLRVDAAIGPEHDLVRSGPYRWVRHPIYASMLCVLLGTGLLLASLPLFPIGVAIFLIGTEIRVRIEDGLLAARFGGAFLDYKSIVPAYLPNGRALPSQ